MLLLFIAQPSAAQVILTWDPSTSAGVAGYWLYYGPQSGTYTTSIDVGTATTYTVAGLISGQTYYFAVTAYDPDGVQSDFSNEVSMIFAPPVSSDVEVIVDNQDLNTAQTGTWYGSYGDYPWEGQSLYSATLDATFRWTPSLPVTGIYQVYAWWTYTSVRATTVPYQIQHQDGITTVTVNQRDVTLRGRWNLLGTFRFAAGSTGSVTVSGQNGNACADAVRFVMP